MGAHSKVKIASLRILAVNLHHGDDFTGIQRYPAAGIRTSRHIGKPIIGRER
jgi:hypothetical protein